MILGEKGEMANKEVTVVTSVADPGFKSLAKRYENKQNTTNL